MSCLMLLSLILASCSSQETTQNQSTDDTGNDQVVITESGTGGTGTGSTDSSSGGGTEQPVTDTSGPHYGGKITLAALADVQFFDPMDWVGGGITLDLTNQRLWDGDWSKGPAGGYGEGLTDWGTSEDVRSNKMGYLAEKISFEVDNENNVGHLIYDIRPGVNWFVNPDNPASVLVGGRDVTADDVVYSLKRTITDPQANIYRSNPFLREAVIEKTGPMQVTVTVPIERLLEAGKRFGDSTFPVAPEVIEKYGSMREWENNVGTGPYMIKDYVSGSAATLEKNPNYWMTDPVGPGKGNQLPYIDEVKWLIIPDNSTRQAGLRSGKIDRLSDVTYEDSKMLDSTTKGLEKKALARLSVKPIYMRTDKAPFDNLQVRRAMMMATDFKTIEEGLYDGTGGILTWPYDYTKAYAGLYLSLDDADCPDSVKELYQYNPDKAKQLLAEAGYPDGFKTDLVLISSEVDYYSIVKDQWSKAGINLNLDVVESGVETNMQIARSHEALITAATGPPSIWPMFSVLTGEGWQNASIINDPTINAATAEIGKMAITDEPGAMAKTRELMKYVLAQAYVIPAASYPSYTYWWPWIKNYSGERSIGYFWVESWPQYCWIDDSLKASMQ